MRSLILTVLFTSALAAHARKNIPPFQVESDAGTALRVSDIEAEVSVNGAFAESTLDLAYYNDSRSAIQGLFKIQLPQGALVRDFALRIGEKWQYGTLTERHKARETFEEIVRRGADPAVLAWKDGAEYQVRIFPFPQKGKRWIRIHYWQDLQQAKSEFIYELPLPEQAKVDHFRMKFSAKASEIGTLKVGAGFSKYAYMKPLSDDKTSFGTMIDEKGFTVPGAFRVSFDQSHRGDVWTAKAQPKGDTAYLAARFFAPLETETRTLPKKVLLFADTSRSSRDLNRTAVEDFIQKLKSRLPA